MKKDKEWSYKIRLSRLLKNNPEKIALKMANDESLTIEESKLAANKSKHLVGFICSECKKESIVQIRRLANRQHGLAYKPICNKCILKVVTNTEGWVNKNSKAQKIAQNKESVKEKQRIAQKKAHERDPSLTARKAVGLRFAQTPEAIKKRIEAHRKRMSNDPDYARKFAPKGYVSGYINDIWFDSSYELLFLIHCFEKEIKVKRCKLRIPYVLEGKAKMYNPDFIVGDKIIELKGAKRKGTRNKTIAANKYCKNNNLVYQIIHRKELEAKKWFKKPNTDFLLKQKIIFVKNNAVMRWLKRFGLSHTKVKFTT